MIGGLMSVLVMLLSRFFRPINLGRLTYLIASDTLEGKNIGLNSAKFYFLKILLNMCCFRDQILKLICSNRFKDQCFVFDKFDSKVKEKMEFMEVSSFLK